ncbi:hypothetical protein TRVL_07606 [Trypanosoma vivax]|nr:hypothetical protein TRVL_07606 [Trypanosoma vivax]
MSQVDYERYLPAREGRVPFLSSSLAWLTLLGALRPLAVPPEPLCVFHGLCGVPRRLAPCRADCCQKLFSLCKPVLPLFSVFSTALDACTDVRAPRCLCVAGVLCLRAAGGAVLFSEPSPGPLPFPASAACLFADVLPAILVLLPMHAVCLSVFLSKSIDFSLSGLLRNTWHAS